MARTGATIRDTDNGFKSLQRELGGRRRRVTVGVHKAEGTKEKEVRGKGKSDRTLAEIAFMHEFGIDVDERSYLRSTMDDNNNFSSEIIRLLTGVIQKKLSLLGALDLLGLEIETKVRDKIRAGIPPELSDVTVAKKGSSLPLVDTGQLIRAIKSEVK